MHVTILPSSPFYVIGAINKESIRRSDVQLAAKQPRVESTSTDVAPASRPSSSSAPPSSSRAEVSLIAIMDQLQLMHADFGSHLNHLSDEICKMNTKIGRIAHYQSRLGGFVPSTLEPTEESSLDGGDADDNDDASSSKTDDEMTASQ